MLEELSKLLKEELKDNLLSAILFGSFLFSDFRDVDIIVITRKKISFDKKFEIERKLGKIFGKKFEIFPFTYEEFLESLNPESFLSGLALGYKILYDEIDVEKDIMEFFEKLAKTKRILVSRHGIFDLGKISEAKLKRKRR